MALQIGSKGDQVRRLQESLNRSGENLDVDGIFGPATKGAVERYQHSKGLSIDGKVSDQLFALLSAKPVLPARELTVGDRIIENAYRFAGLHEVLSNKKWEPAGPAADELASAMEASGWSPGEPYCAAFVEMVWKPIYSSNLDKYTLFTKNMTPHVMTSYNNFNKLGLISQNPAKGAVFFMQNGNSDSGHAGLVRGINGDTLLTIEANTSPVPTGTEKDREGDGVYAKTRYLPSFQKRKTGLWIRGYLNPL